MVIFWSLLIVILSVLGMGYGHGYIKNQWDMSLADKEGYLFGLYVGVPLVSSSLIMSVIVGMFWNAAALWGLFIGLMVGGRYLWHKAFEFSNDKFKDK